MRLNILLLLILLIATNTYSQPVINITDDKPILAGASFLVNYDRTPIDDVIEVMKNGNFVQNDKQQILMGMSRPKNIWMKFTVHNQMKENAYLELLFPLTDTAKLYTVENGQITEVQETGSAHKVSDRLLFNNNLTFNLKASDKPVTYYLNVRVRWICNVKPNIGTFKALYKESHYYNLVNGIFIGIILVSLLYNLFVYYKLRDIVYVLYSLYLLFISGFVLRHEGYLNELIFNGNLMFNDYSIALGGLSGLFGMLFTLYFLSLPKNLPQILPVVQIMAILFGMSAIWAINGHLELSIVTANFLTPISTLVALYCAFKMWRLNDNSAKYYFVGWLILTFCLAIFILENSGYINYNLFTANAIQIGISLEAIILFAAIAQRFSAMKTEKENIQEGLIEVMKENELLINQQNRILELKVAERTKELRIALMKFNQSELKLQDYARNLEKSNRELTEFAHIASHDLKAPIRNIMSFAQLFERRHKAKFDETDIEYFNYIKTNAQQSARLIDDLLSYSKIDKNLGEPTEIDLDKCLFIVESNLQTLIREKNAIVEYDDLPKLRGHSSLITQLFQNLINNGIKYNQSEQPKIVISTRMNSEGQCVFSIQDNGIGIAPENFKTVFAMFRRLHSQSEYEGSGIGLSFCTRIVETYEGKIWLESEVGVGTTFYFTLPKTCIKQEALELEAV